MTSELLGERKEAILRAVVQGYISTSRPVGSATVSAESQLQVSSATIRKDLGSLEEDGYLQQPHTSAGRIPTEKGYRYFVDLLMQPAELDGIRRERISEFFERTHGELERMLRQTSSLLAGVTDYTAVVVPPAPDTATVLSSQLVEISAGVGLLVVVLSNGGVERRSIDMPEPFSATQVAEASDLVSEALVGSSVPVNEMPSHRDSAVADVAAAAVAAFGAPERRGNRLFVGGAHSVAGTFEESEVAEGVLEMLEKQFLVVSLIRDLLDRGKRVAIGTETGMEDLNECSVVVAPYVVEGEEIGSIGVLGPTRMNYPQALAAVAVVSDRLGVTLSER